MNMREAFEAFMASDEKFPDGCNMTERVFNAGYRAALASQAQQSQWISVGEVNNKYGDPEAFAERSYYIDEQILQTVPIGYKLVAIPPAPDGGE